MRRADRTTFDFQTGTWVRSDPTTPTDLVPSTQPRPWTEPARGRWTKPAPPPSKLSERLVALVVWATAALVILAMVLKSLAPLGIAAVPLTLLCAALATREASDSRVTEADRRLLEDPDDRDVCLVLLTIVRDGETIGKDKGVVWFADGALLYSGHRTSFALGGEDVLPREAWHVYLRPDGNDGLPDTAVPLRLPSGHAYVHLEPLTEGNQGGTPQEMRFRKSLYDFRRRPPLSRIPRQWPPLEP